MNYHMTQHFHSCVYVWKKSPVIQKDKCTQMFVAILFTTVKIWKEPKCPSRDKRIKKMCVCIYIYTHEFDPWIRKISWRRRKPTLEFLLEKSHLQRSLSGYSPKGHKESDMNEWLNMHACTHTHTHTHTHTYNATLLSHLKRMKIFHLQQFIRWMNLKGICFMHAHLCPNLCDPMGCGPPGFSLHGILQARILELVAISYCRGFSQPGDQTHVFCVSWEV